MKSVYIIGLLAGFLCGMIIGGALGRLDSRREHAKQLTEMGCAGYDYETGKWSLTPGATCRVPIDMVEIEPEN